MTEHGKGNHLEVVLQRIGSESFKAVRAREKSTFAKFAGQNEKRLILFGRKAGAPGGLNRQESGQLRLPTTTKSFGTRK